MPLLAIGGGSGVLIAYWMLGAIVPSLPSTMPRVEGVAIDTPVQVFAAAMLVLTAS